MIHERWPEKVPCIPLLSQRWWDTFTNLWPRWYPPNVSPFAKVTNPQFSGENISPATSPRSQCRLHFSLRHLAGTQRSIDFVLTHIGVVVNCQANLWGSGGKHNSWVSWCFGWRLRVLGSHWGVVPPPSNSHLLNFWTCRRWDPRQCFPPAETWRKHSWLYKQLTSKTTTCICVNVWSHVRDMTNGTTCTYPNHGRRGAERFLRRPVEGWKYAQSHLRVDSLFVNLGRIVKPPHRSEYPTCVTGRRQSHDNGAPTTLLDTAHFQKVIHDPATVTTRTRHFQEGIPIETSLSIFSLAGGAPVPRSSPSMVMLRGYLFCQPYSHFGGVVCIWGRNDSPKWIR